MYQSSTAERGRHRSATFHPNLVCPSLSSVQISILPIAVSLATQSWENMSGSGGMMGTDWQSVWTQAYFLHPYGWHPPRALGTNKTVKANTHNILWPSLSYAQHTVRREAACLHSMAHCVASREGPVKRFRGGLVFKADRLVYHSTLGLRVIKTKRRVGRGSAVFGRERLIRDLLAHFVQQRPFHLLTTTPHFRWPLSRKYGTHKPVKARFWPWLEPFSVRKSLKPFTSSPSSDRFTCSLPLLTFDGRCRANMDMAHIRQSRPDSGLGFQVKFLKTFNVPSSLGSGFRLLYTKR